MSVFFNMFSSKIGAHIVGFLISICLSGSLQAQSAEALMTKAVKDNDLAAFKAMVADGADPNAGLFGNALINTASLQGRAEIVAFMLEQGVDPLVFDNGFAPIHLAVNGDHVDVVRVFLDAGVPMDLATKESWEPPLLMQAARNNSLKTINFLLDRGADINMRDKCNDPAIAAAAYWGMEEALHLFINRGADLTTRSGTGVVCIPGATAVSYARRQGHDHIAEILLKAGAIE